MTLQHPHGEMLVYDKGETNLIEITMKDGRYSPFTRCNTAYSTDLLATVFDIKGPAYVCDEILRDESPDYVQKAIEYGILSFVSKREFSQKRILDFGCGGGSSTSILARIFPESRIVGVELDERLLRIARARADFYNLADRVSFYQSPDPESLPKDLGTFDFITFSAVYEHLLPNERKPLLHKVWRLLNTDGVIFINQTPNRYGIVEYHTTSGMPLINYLPDRVTHYLVSHFSKRRSGSSWEQLLRAGIRGATPKEICSSLRELGEEGIPVRLEPHLNGVHNDIELWYRSTSTMSRRSAAIKRAIRTSAYVLWPLRQFMLPTIILAIRKQKGEDSRSTDG